MVSGGREVFPGATLYADCPAPSNVALSVRETGSPASSGKTPLVDEICEFAPLRLGCRADGFYRSHSEAAIVAFYCLGAVFPTSWRGGVRGGVRGPAEFSGGVSFRRPGGCSISTEMVFGGSYSGDPVVQRAVVRSRSLPDWLRPACRVLAGPSIPGWGENGEGFGESPRGMTPAGPPIFLAPAAHGAEGVTVARLPAGFPPSRRWRTGGLRRSRLLLPG